MAIFRSPGRIESDGRPEVDFVARRDRDDREYIERLIVAAAAIVFLIFATCATATVVSNEPVPTPSGLYRAWRSGKLRGVLFDSAGRSDSGRREVD